MGCSGGLWYLKKVLRVFVKVRLVRTCREHLSEVRDQQMEVCLVFVKLW